MPCSDGYLSKWISEGAPAIFGSAVEKRQILCDALRQRWKCKDHYQLLIDQDTKPSDIVVVDDEEFYEWLVNAFGVGDHLLSHVAILVHQIPLRNVWLGRLGKPPINAVSWQYCNALKFGHIRLLNHLFDDVKARDKLEKDGIEFCNDGTVSLALDEAACGGMNVFQVAMRKGGLQRLSVMAIQNAAEHGHLDLIVWISEKRPEYVNQRNTSIMDFAARNGHLEIVTWLHNNRTDGCSKAAMDDAAEMGHLEVVKFLHENRTEGCTDWAMNYAAQNGHLDVVEWLFENRLSDCQLEDALLYAKQTHQHHVMEWINHLKTTDIKGKHR